MEVTKSMTATERLVAALRALPAHPDLARIIAEVEGGLYDDYRSAVPYPKIALARRVLMAYGNTVAAARELVADVKAGKYDEGEEEADAWFASLPAAEQREIIHASRGHLTASGVRAERVRVVTDALRKP